MEDVDQFLKDHCNLALDGQVDDVDLVSMVRNSWALVLGSQVQVVDQDNRDEDVNLVSKVLSSQVLLLVSQVDDANLGAAVLSSLGAGRCCPAWQGCGFVWCITACRSRRYFGRRI